LSELLVGAKNIEEIILTGSKDKLLILILKGKSSKDFFLESPTANPGCNPPGVSAQHLLIE